MAVPLAELLAVREAEDARVEAVRLFRRVALLAPLSRAAREAEERASALLAAMTPEARREVGDPPAEEQLARAAALEGAMRFEDAERAFEEASRAIEDAALRCRALLGRGRSVYYQRDRRRAAGLLAGVADACEEEDVRGWARYLSGKAYAASGDPARALAQYGELERQVPDHRLADDARFRAALIDAERGDRATMVERLSTLPERYPSGDMHGEARFLLAWRARHDGRRDEALAQLDASLREGTGETAEDIRGRAAYWRGVLLHELGRADEAREAFAALAAERPLGYYSQQAMARLRELSPAGGARGGGSGRAARARGRRSGRAATAPSPSRGARSSTRRASRGRWSSCGWARSRTRAASSRGCTRPRRGATRSCAGSRRRCSIGRARTRRRCGWRAGTSRPSSSSRPRASTTRAGASPTRRRTRR
ncbi:MAG: tetratricopeptide repeat protein [Sandaracinaceae bacterium]|nr:tetratricopeptide repeat protein [Sandaracinaceae bacterium]